MYVTLYVTPVKGHPVCYPRKKTPWMLPTYKDTLYVNQVKGHPVCYPRKRTACMLQQDKYISKNNIFFCSNQF